MLWSGLNHRAENTSDYHSRGQLIQEKYKVMALYAKKKKKLSMNEENSSL